MKYPELKPNEWIEIYKIKHPSRHHNVRYHWQIHMMLNTRIQSYDGYTFTKWGAKRQAIRKFMERNQELEELYHGEALIIRIEGEE